MGMRRKNLRLKRRVVCGLGEPRKAPSPFRKIHLMLKRCPQATHSSLHYRRTPRSYREDQDQKSCPANLRRAMLLQWLFVHCWSDSEVRRSGNTWGSSWWPCAWASRGGVLFRCPVSGRAQHGETLRMALFRYPVRPHCQVCVKTSGSSDQMFSNVHLSSCRLRLSEHHEAVN
ncbi:unnamed protein product [Symbiodinium necroappetens]|uniref:Uncharacterized protein n=1 Tax=Symbiodinium necroappetens TaxID=1628268 RepID=A0A812VR92_9DINO|nr:unnamed protein product [Symbiodinium necroappetens]